MKNLAAARIEARWKSWPLKPLKPLKPTQRSDVTLRHFCAYSSPKHISEWLSG